MVSVPFEIRRAPSTLVLKVVLIRKVTLILKGNPASVNVLVLVASRSFERHQIY